MRLYKSSKARVEYVRVRQNKALRDAKEKHWKNPMKREHEKRIDQSWVYNSSIEMKFHTSSIALR